MKFTAKFLYDLQWGTTAHLHYYDEQTNGTKSFWEGYAERVNAALSVAQTNQDEQTDDSSGVPSQCSGVFVQTLENEK